MPLTGLFLLPIAPNQPSPSSILISHISRSFPAEPLPPFHLDHRLFVDTSSLLPNADVSQRKFTSILTLSHSPVKTYIGTFSPAPKEKTQAANVQQAPASTIITIPSASADSFTQLIGTKLQPQWAHRQSLVIENGTSLSLQNGQWILRIGDLKTPTRPNQTAGSNLRGMLVEVSHIGAPIDRDLGLELKTQEANIDKDDETMMRAFLDSVTSGSGAPPISSMEIARSLFRRTRIQNETQKDSSVLVDWPIAGLYMDMLRGSRG